LYGRRGKYDIFIPIFILFYMALGLRVLFYPKSREYEVVSQDGYRLKMSEPEFLAIKGQMNGIALALADQARERKKQSRDAISSSFSDQPSRPEDPIV
jgi:hypothetical protein